jgi:hypothetical protein
MDNGTRNLLYAIANFAELEPFFDGRDHGIRLASVISALSRDSGFSEEKLRSELEDAIKVIRPRSHRKSS